jgi:hypothetical protein
MIVLFAEQPAADWTAIGVAALLTLAAGGFLLFTSIMTCRLVVPDRVKKVATGMNLMLLFFPVLAAAVFAVLFAFVLKGRFYERLCHATLVLALWLYAARYWWFVIAYYKYMSGRALYGIIPIIVLLAAMAIGLTPLDKYAPVHSALGAAGILPGIGLLLFFYVAAFFTTCANKNRMHSDLWRDMWWF